jgi:hypothetical protein
LRILLRVLAMFAIAGGIVAFLLAVTIGDCSAFGGACPNSGIDDDVIGTAAVAGAMVGAGFVFVVRPVLRAALRAVLVGGAAAIVAALVAHGMTSS